MIKIANITIYRKEKKIDDNLKKNYVNNYLIIISKFILCNFAMYGYWSFFITLNV